MEAYQLHLLLREISPAIWRRVLVRGDATIADLHCTIQLTMGWSDTHLNRFHIYGKDYGVPHEGGMSFSDRPSEIRLCDFGLRRRERFLYEYDFADGWQLDVRLECREPISPTRDYPKCIGGSRACPPEDCGGAWAFMALEDHYNPIAILCRLQAFVDGDEDVPDLLEELEAMRRWLNKDRFDIDMVNERLARYRNADNPLEYSVI